MDTDDAGYGERCRSGPICFLTRKSAPCVIGGWSAFTVLALIMGPLLGMGAGLAGSVSATMNAVRQAGMKIGIALLGA